MTFHTEAAIDLFGLDNGNRPTAKADEQTAGQLPMPSTPSLYGKLQRCLTVRVALFVKSFTLVLERMQTAVATVG